MSRTPRLALIAALLAARAATASDAPPPPATPPLETLMAQALTEVERVFSFGEGLEFAAGELGAGRVVKGAPYCADAVHETVQWLHDSAGGAPNRVVRQTSTRLCRDGEGRTRQETERGGRKLVYLRDPVARENWVLDPERKTARRLGLPGLGDVEVHIERAREQSERAREQARTAVERARTAGTAVAPVPPVPPVPPIPPMPVIVTTGEGPGGGVRTETRVLRLNRDGESIEWTPAPVQWRAQAFAPRGAGSVSPLGTRDIEGVRANGERTTWTIEAGKIGNEKPILITREVWTAPDLMVTVSSRDFDPRTGETNYRLKGIKRGEPDVSLMRVPADFAKPAPRPSPRASGAAG